MSNIADRPLKLVVKHTFLELEYAETPVNRGRAQTDSLLFDKLESCSDWADYVETPKARRADTDSSMAETRAGSRTHSDMSFDSIDSDWPDEKETEVHESAVQRSSVPRDCMQSCIPRDEPQSPTFVPTSPWICTAGQSSISPATHADIDATVVELELAEAELKVAKLRAQLAAQRSKAGAAASSAGRSAVSSVPAASFGAKAPPEDGSGCTTLMLRNLPNDYSRDMLLELLDSQGLGGQYDFVYVPFDFDRRAGLGYGFVNMITPEGACNALHKLQGFRRWALRSKKVLQVVYSKPLQGLAANVERYRNSAVMHPDVPQQFKPVLFRNGCCIPFPAPTRTLSAPATTGH